MTGYPDTIGLDRPGLLSAEDMIPTEHPIGRNGFAYLSDLETPRMAHALREMEAFQLEFMASTREIWTPNFPFTGDCLYNWSRRWEYPYCWHGLPPAKVGVPGIESGTGADTGPGSRRRILDAGSGVTFFPFFLERRGFRVSCADPNASLTSPFTRVAAMMQSANEFRICGIEKLAWPDATFDVVVCVSVLEHVSAHSRAIEELARVLKPGGRLLLTCDIDLSRRGDVLMEDAAVLIASLDRRLEALYPWDLQRSSDLLTTDRMLATESWRLPWRESTGRLRRWLASLRGGRAFRSLAVMGSAWVRKS